jgi:hypothetical protein
MVLMGGAHFARFSFSGIKGEFISVASSGNSTTAVPNVSDYDVYEVIVMGTLRGFGQVFLADDKYAGFLVMFGMFICSPIGWFSALIGSFIGTLTGMWVGAPPAVIQAGLWSYNSLLGAAAINGVFYTPSFRALFTCMLCGWGCALVGGALTVAFALTGLPTMTYPFCIVTFAFLLLQRSGAYGLKAVPLAHVTTPEIHLARQIKKDMLDRLNAQRGSKDTVVKRTGRLRRILSYNDGYMGNKPAAAVVASTVQANAVASQSHSMPARLPARFPSFRSLEMDFTSTPTAKAAAAAPTSSNKDVEEGKAAPPARLPTRFPSFRSLEMDFTSTPTAKAAAEANLTSFQVNKQPEHSARQASLDVVQQREG